MFPDDKSPEAVAKWGMYYSLHQEISGGKSINVAGHITNIFNEDSFWYNFWYMNDKWKNPQIGWWVSKANNLHTIIQVVERIVCTAMGSAAGAVIMYWYIK